MSFAKKSFSIFRQDIILFATNLITSVIVARVLGPISLGIWMILLLVPSYAEAFGRLKVDVASVYTFGQKKYPKQDILLVLNIIAFISSTILILFILWQFNFLYGILFVNESGDYRPFLLVLLLQIPLQSFLLNYAYFHIAHENVTIYNRKTIIQAWSYSIIVIILLLFSNLGLWSIIIASELSILFALLYSYFKVDRSGWTVAKWDKSLCFNMIKYGLNFYLGGILGHFQEQGTRTISIAFLSPSKIAFLGQAQMIGRLLNKIPEAINTMLYPRASKLNKKDVIKLCCQAFRVSFILLLLGNSILFLFAESLIPFIYGSSFKGTAHILKLIIPGLTVYGACLTLEAFFNGTGRAHVLPRIQILPVLIQLITAYIFTKAWGADGAALAFSIGISIYGIFLLIVFIIISRVSYKKLIPLWSDLKYIINFVRTLVLLK